MKTMDAIVIREPKKITIEKVPFPEIKADEVLIKIRANGMCMNDVRDYLGNTVYTFPRIGGHEFSGEVVEVGSHVRSELFQVGDHVVKYIIPACGQCHYCKINRPNLCEYVYTSKTFQNAHGISGFGGLAQYMAVKATELYRYPKEVPFTHMALTEPVGCVINSIERANLEFGQDVLVIGAGVMGLLHVILAKKKGTRVIVSEPQKERRELALRLGADVVVDALDKNVVEEVKQQTGGRGADIVFNTNERPNVAQQAMAFTAKGGKTFMFSSIHPRELVPTDLGAVHSEEKLITGTVSPTNKTYYQAVQMIGKGLISVEPFIEQTIDYRHAEEAYQAASRPDSFKIIVTFD